jgi:hypothetical protein
MAADKFHLRYSEVVQGDFKLGKLNLMLVFQVNCPECFAHALPVLLRLYEEYKGTELKILGLSTAFEDFEYNTLGNTIRLLDKGQVVGKTKKMLERAGYEKFPLAIPFDIAFDELKPNDLSHLEEDIDQFCRNNADFNAQNAEVKRNIKDQLREYFSKKTMRAYTFDANHLNGTPSWVLFDKDRNLLYESFGHKEYERLEHIIKKFLGQNP